MFRTEVVIQPASHQISLGQRILFLGSCFAEGIGQRMVDHKWRTLINPFGVIYDPLSLIRLLTYALKMQTPDLDSYVKNQGIYYNYQLHSRFSDPQLESLQKSIKEKLVHTKEFLESTDWIMFTLGTAHVFRIAESQNMVANCHKMPSQLFQQELLSVDQIVTAFDQLMDLLQETDMNPRVLLTVSPVRHIKTGLVENSLSKATLRIAANELEKRYKQVSYFPSYEILMDDLRDYRFYEKDMIHPNEVSEDYIWKRFGETYFDQAANRFMESWSKILQALQHKPFHPKSESHQNFIKKTLVQMNTLPVNIDTTEEKNILQKQLL